MSMKARLHLKNVLFDLDGTLLPMDLDEFIKRRFTLQDWPAWVILTAYTDIDVLPESTATWCIETVSITRPDSVERYAKRLEGDREVCRYLGELFPKKFPYDEHDWNNYASGRLMAKAFDVDDYESAKRYGGLYSGGGFKKLCSRNRVLFEIWRLLKRMKGFRS